MAVFGEWLVTINGGQDLLELGQGADPHQALAKPCAEWESLGVPPTVFSKAAHRGVLATPVDEQGCVLDHEVCDLAKGRRRPRLGTREDVCEIAEKPRPPEATSPHRDTVAPGLSNHPEGVVGDPDVAVADDRNSLERMFEFRNCLPSRLTVIELGGRTRVQRDGGTPFLFGDVP